MSWAPSGSEACVTLPSATEQLGSLMMTRALRSAHGERRSPGDRVTHAAVALIVGRAIDALRLEARGHGDARGAPKAIHAAAAALANGGAPAREAVRGFGARGPHVEAAQAGAADSHVPSAIRVRFARRAAREQALVRAAYAARALRAHLAGLANTILTKAAPAAQAVEAHVAVLELAKARAAMAVRAVSIHHARRAVGAGVRRRARAGAVAHLAHDALGRCGARVVARRKERAGAGEVGERARAARAPAIAAKSPLAKRAPAVRGGVAHLAARARRARWAAAVDVGLVGVLQAVFAVFGGAGRR